MRNFLRSLVPKTSLLAIGLFLLPDSAIAKQGPTPPRTGSCRCSGFSRYRRSFRRPKLLGSIVDSMELKKN